MKLEQQVTNLELSKKLKELGVKQESLYKWNVPDLDFESKEYNADNFLESELVPKLYTQEQWEEYTTDYIPPDSEIYSAFTVAELGEKLKKNDKPPFWTERGWSNIYCKVGQEFSDTEANARAKMKIYLIENKLI